MSFISYAQNNEDVLLWRALRHVEGGFYIDVGANGPVEDSVTKAFYDAGWCGINIEPMPLMHQALLEARPRDLNLALAAGAAKGELTLYDIPSVNGWASAEPAVAAAHRADGLEVAELTVPVQTLATICTEHVKGEIHFLKIDVEGFEGEVLRGMDFARWRPWVLVVEATLPNSRVSAHEGWEPLVTGQRYRFVWFDGLNRYYVAEEHAELAAAFGVQPNFFDDFVTYRQHEALAGVDYLTEALRQTEAYVATLTAALHESQARADSLERALHQAQPGDETREPPPHPSQARADSLEQDLHQSQARAAGLEQALHRSQAQAADLERALHRSQAQAADLERALHQAQARAGSTEQALRDSQARADSLEHALQASQAHADGLAAMLREAQAQAAQSDAAMRDALQRTWRLRDRSESTDERTESLCDRIEEQARENAAAQAEIDTLRVALAKAQLDSHHVSEWAHDLNNRLVAILDSSSWRLTGPWRAAGGMLRSLREPGLARRLLPRITTNQALRRLLLPVLMRHPALRKQVETRLIAIKHAAPDPASAELRELPVSARGVLADLQRARGKHPDG